MYVLAIIFFIIPIIMIISLLWDLLKTGLATIFWVFAQIWKSIMVDAPMKRSGFLEQKLLEQKMVEAQYTQKCRDQLIHQQNRIISAGINKVCELRAKYTYADEQLFLTLLQQYPILSVQEIQIFESQIRESHLKNK